MLKRLELVGFKSFAEKTSFDFADGVTGIVGPNGSGKSNVVDAIKWVLGEQSAKSLRGGEMTDVIFNGSASRRSLGMAEVSMVFDNGKKVLASDAVEVRVTRRVYRSGESEYCINGSPCRLKDVKDLFLGSGAGTDAYSIIEQGRVDVLLQTSPKERRTIFEEAAGISRFKARKIETLRKLERTSANLQLLRATLDELEKQLRSVRLQASKAQQHQQHTTRLRELRVALSLREYRQVSLRLAEESAALDALKAALERRTSEADSGAQELAGIEEDLARVETAVAGVEAELSEARRQLAAEAARRQAEMPELERTEEEIARTRQRLAALSLEAQALTQAWGQAARDLEQAEEQAKARAQVVKAHEEAVVQHERRLEELRQEAEQHRGDHFDQSREAGTLQNSAEKTRALIDAQSRERDKLRQRGTQAAESLQVVDAELETMAGEDAELQARLAAAREAQAGLRAERERLTAAREGLADRASEERATRSGLISRVEVLEELERSHEGLGTGVREVLEHLHSPDPGPWRAVVGLVAERMAVKRDYARLIDIALGERAQRFLVADPAELEQALRERGAPLSSRVSFLHLPSRVGPLDIEDPPDHPGLVAFAERVVKCDVPGLASLLLGNTLIVRDLQSAREVLAQTTAYRCVTRAGELLEADGTLTVGDYAVEAGILSRRSELLDLREQVRRIDGRLADLEQKTAVLRDEAADLDGRAEQAQAELDALAEQVQELKGRITRQREKREVLSSEVTLSRGELVGLEREIEGLEEVYAEVVAQQRQAEQRAEAARLAVEQAEQDRQAIEAERAARQQQATLDRVELAKWQERLASLKSRHKGRDADRAARLADAEQAEGRLDELLARREELMASLLRGSAAMSDWYRRKELAERTAAEGQALRGQLRGRRQQLSVEVQASRGDWQQQQQDAHAREMEVSKLRHQAEALCARLDDDYQIDLDAVYREHLEAGRLELFDGPTPTADPQTQEPIAPEDEIADLRRRLSKLGSVNLEALEELEELEARHSGLHVQYDDLVEARRELEEIIGRINTDSRKLFQETFDAVRAHFIELFRKLFGGGQADVVLEEGVDILESGIEIMARPPGKELRSISLMSGGEKTMTAVALLLAIFRSKPSPFCILDEVDAALDEANVGRFTGVLKEFIERSQFILITHHKRTMAAADVLIGVTMAEPGVSSRYSVRFEDWPDDERQAQAA